MAWCHVKLHATHSRLLVLCRRKNRKHSAMINFHRFEGAFWLTRRIDKKRCPVPFYFLLARVQGSRCMWLYTYGQNGGFLFGPKENKNERGLALLSAKAHSDPHLASKPRGDRKWLKRRVFAPMKKKRDIPISKSSFSTSISEERALARFFSWWVQNIRQLFRFLGFTVWSVKEGACLCHTSLELV